jgi:hypothetical protein
MSALVIILFFVAAFFAIAAAFFLGYSAGLYCGIARENAWHEQRGTAINKQAPSGVFFAVDRPAGKSN